MEVLLLDTTEKEGEDNTLYHYVHSSDRIRCFSISPQSSKTDTARWLDLRGVLAAAVGATTSLCGESLQFARFSSGDTNDSAGIVGFVNIYEVLYVLVFASTDLPTSIVQYYTRSSCDLLLSFFGYPDAKLDKWRRRDGCSISTATLSTQLDTIFRGIFSAIQNDLRFGSHLQFVFDGRVPAVNYPLETMAKLAVLDMPFGASTASTQTYSVVGRCIFYRKHLVISTMRRDFLRMIFQWLLDGDHFTPDSSVTRPAPESSNESDRPPTRIDTFELHDFRFTRHGEYPKRHAFLIVNRGHLALVFALERKLEVEGNERAIGWAKQFASGVDQHSVEVLASFCDQNLDMYLKDSHKLRQQRMEALQAQFSQELQREPESPIHDAASSHFLWYSVALDRLRGVIIGDALLSSVHGGHNREQQQTHDSIMTQFVQYLAAYQQSTQCLHETHAETSPELPSGIPPLKLDVDDPHTLFLRERPTDEASADISTGDAHIFPQSHSMQNAFEKNGRTPRQTAERIVVRGQPLWIIVNSYETLQFFSILDTALPLELLDHELNRLCAFGGAEPAEALDSEK
ncbi:hypothetical protein PRNP1_007756 [Phytophthora ramorum]